MINIGKCIKFGPISSFKCFTGKCGNKYTFLPSDHEYFVPFFYTSLHFWANILRSQSCLFVAKSEICQLYEKINRVTTRPSEKGKLQGNAKSKCKC